MEEYKQKKELQYEQAVANEAKEAMKKEAEAIELAKRIQHMENSKYLHYLDKIRFDEREMNRNNFDPKCVSLITEEFEEANVKCHAKKQQLHSIMKVCIIWNGIIMIISIHPSIISILAIFQKKNLHQFKLNNSFMIYNLLFLKICRVFFFFFLF